MRNFRLETHPVFDDVDHGLNKTAWFLIVSWALIYVASAVV